MIYLSDNSVNTPGPKLYIMFIFEISTFQSGLNKLGIVEDTLQYNIHTPPPEPKGRT